MTSEKKVKYFEDENRVIFTGDIYTQWYQSDFTIDDFVFCCTEQFFMFKKALYFNDIDTMCKILHTKIPKEHKELGRSVKNFDDEIWNTIADEYVFEGNYAKFSQNNELKEKLLSTKDKIIIEAAAYDSRWGSGLNMEDTIASKVEDIKGENRLGKAIMRVREQLMYDKFN
jgi:ribA/ribD-fused uncharacterized protein